MHAMAAGEEHDGAGAGKHVTAADGAVALQAPLHALVFPEGKTHTCVTLVAVEIINSEAFPNTANIAVRTVVDFFLGVIIVEFAHCAVIFRK